MTNRFEFEYKPESFSFKLILKVIVKDSDTIFVHTFFLYSQAFWMKKSTASCFNSQKTLNTNIIIVKMREQCFVQVENYSNRS